MSGKAILKEIGSTLLYIVVVLGITWLVITFVGQRTDCLLYTSPSPRDN